MLCSLLVCVAATPAAAADRPKPGALYREGPRDATCSTASGSTAPTRPTRGWPASRRSLPGGMVADHDPNASNAGDFSSASYLGQVHWYRKDFNLPKGASPSDNYVFRFESVNYRAKAWLNGKPIGFNVGAYLPFEFRAKGVKKGDNRLVVKVDSRRQPFDIPPLSQRSTGNFEGGWWNYNGILREVYLRHVKSLDAEEVLAEPTVRCRTPSACDDLGQGRGQGPQPRQQARARPASAARSAIRASTSSARSVSGRRRASRSSRARMKVRGPRAVDARASEPLPPAPLAAATAAASFRPYDVHIPACAAGTSRGSGASSSTAATSTCAAPRSTRTSSPAARR